MPSVFDCAELVECAAPDCADGEVIPERMHSSGLCVTCCPFHTVDCPECWPDGDGDEDEE